VPLPHLHILHPRENRFSGITALLASVEQMLAADANWDHCAIRRAEYDEQAAFDVPTQCDLIRRSPGPVILIQNVQARLRDRLANMLDRQTVVYTLNVVVAEDLWLLCETARLAYEDGEPRIHLRELIGYLIVRKLERQGKWGGTSLNKAFLWSENLPKGGFPKDILDKRDIFNVATELERFGVLTSKTSNGQKKYALGSKQIVQPILDTKSFVSCPQLYPFFRRDARLVTARQLDYDDEVVAAPPP
jgi:hypothetical protein